MAAKFILSSRYFTKPTMAAALATVLKADDTARVFVSMDSDEVLELRALEEGTDLDALNAVLMPQAVKHSEYLAADVRRELLSFVEAPKDCEGVLPATPFVQLRHVEVKPDRTADYRKWREETIFDVVRAHEPAEVFLAYHSVISGQPGVMFIAGFSSSPEEYTAAFTSDRYAEIVRQAGDTYITGGTEGLYTKIYQQSLAQAA
ncbi:MULTISPECIES: hypothetical protein [unclassified Aureimonas]|uniref:hypothetical protein n=1 Tax=unclassified Aureimonas TaxID=2615206 RepID=UPI0006FEBB50|nr:MULTISPECIES: hypothetical protein [unclassified Aureimonas]KQT61218.1 hypothetical protein ASG54_24050 [Aureimonas sp. Leaf460]KQT68667.1 hypothetical protein ASG62_18810 [Aureimonas sp. Leaf427]